MGFEPCSVRQIDDAGRDVIEGGGSVIGGNGGRARIAKGRREAEHRASPKPARGRGRVSLSNHRLSGGRARRGGGGHDWGGRVRPAEEFLDDVAVVGRGGGGASDRHIGP